MADGQNRPALASTADWERIWLTECWRMDTCRYDTGCPFLDGCRIADAEMGGDG